MINRLKKHTTNLISFAFGALAVLAFAPFQFPGLALISLGVLFYLLQKATTFKGGLIAYSYGLGFFGFGVSWVYVSIHQFGHIPWYAASLLTLLFIATIALYFLLLGLFFCYFFFQAGKLTQAFAFACSFTLIEYLRSYFLTGFPWLLIGYSQQTTPLAIATPVVGVYGISFFSVLAASFVALFFQTLQKEKITAYYYAALLVLIYLIPALCLPNTWTTTKPNTYKIGIVQANIEKKDKWNIDKLHQLLTTYYHNTIDLLDSDIIFWPESAIPVPFHYLDKYYDTLNSLLNNKNSALIAGIPIHTTKSSHSYYNAMRVLGNGQGQYNKYHLVPFGEYNPLTPLNGLIKRLAIPMANMQKGRDTPSLLLAKGLNIAPFICYDIAYNDLLYSYLKQQADILVTITDDAWFGHSHALAQHLQIAAIRSLESGRYQVVASNNGLSAIITPLGHIQQILPAHKQGLLKGTVYAMQGKTPWAYWGNKPIILFLMSFLVLLTCLQLISLTYFPFVRRKGPLACRNLTDRSIAEG